MLTVLQLFDVNSKRKCDKHTSNNDTIISKDIWKGVGREGGDSHPHLYKGRMEICGVLIYIKISKGNYRNEKYIMKN